MAYKTIPTLAFGLSVLVLATAPVAAQSMFEQMPTIPEPGAAPAPSDAAAPAAPSASVPSASMMPLPSMEANAAAPVPVPPAQSLAHQAPGGTDCSAIQKTLIERKNLVAKANTASQSKQKMTPQQACSLFGQLQANGQRGMKWISDNKEWCSIPDSFSEGFKADHVKVSGIRTKVCGMVAQYTKMEAQARAQAQNGGGGLLGGPGLSGSFKMPQGAL